MGGNLLKGLVGERNGHLDFVSPGLDFVSPGFDCVAVGLDFAPCDGALS
jgi:hypothetical protein